MNLHILNYFSANFDNSTWCRRWEIKEKSRSPFFAQTTAIFALRGSTREDWKASETHDNSWTVCSCQSYLQSGTQFFCVEYLPLLPVGINYFPAKTLGGRHTFSKDELKFMTETFETRFICYYSLRYTARKRSTSGQFSSLWWYLIIIWFFFFLLFNVHSVDTESRGGRLRIPRKVQ